MHARIASIVFSKPVCSALTLYPPLLALLPINMDACEQGRRFSYKTNNDTSS